MYSTILEKLVKVFADFILPYLYDDGFYATQREAGKKGEKKEGEIPPFGHPFSWLQQTDFFIPSSLEISDHTLRASRRVCESLIWASNGRSARRVFLRLS